MLLWCIKNTRLNTRLYQAVTHFLRHRFPFITGHPRERPPPVVVPPLLLLLLLSFPLHFQLHFALLSLLVC